MNKMTLLSVYKPEKGDIFQLNISVIENKEKLGNKFFRYAKFTSYNGWRVIDEKERANAIILEHVKEHYRFREVLKIIFQYVFRVPKNEYIKAEMING